MPVEKSCGAVIFCGREYLLLKYGWGHWGFVKGNIEKGETMEETFFREAEEEAGLKRENLKIIEGFREKISYFYRKEGRTIFKVVVYLLAESNTKDVKLSFEHTDYAWLPFEEAIERVTYDGDKKVLRKAHEFLKKIGKM
ncbi:MAG: NUDIX domain-containing protein [Thermoplasmata archaeon]|jgi:8-oxo-dGTP pyrophosphatase MutT (NUDIX family)|nr:MAG: NUDIX domain-containing protein [Thermoplasmata archaeon]MCD6222947.1 NUDIX domain-containing protein [Thermoplasmata archaeon]